MVQHADETATPNVRLYETLVGAAVAVVLMAAAALAARLADYTASTTTAMLCFLSVWIGYLAGVALYAWRLVGENEWAAGMVCARLTEYKRARKFPLVKLWLLY